MTGIELLPKTLDYGRETLTSASWITLGILTFFVSTMFMLLKVQWVLVAPFKGDKKPQPVSPIVKARTGLKAFVKALPGITLLILALVFVRWLASANIDYRRTSWQSDYFIGFMLTFFLFVLLLIYELQLEVWRRTITWKIVNAMFKLVSSVFAGLILAPYYVLATAKKESFLSGGGFTYGLIIFTSYCFICLYCFKGSPLSTLIPMIVLWGADMSYYTLVYTLKYGIGGNGTGIVVALFGLFGVSLFKAVTNVQKVASPQFMLAYCAFLFILIAGIWMSLWDYYGYPVFGTNHESFIQSSFYPD